MFGYGGSTYNEVIWYVWQYPRFYSDCFLIVFVCSLRLQLNATVAIYYRALMY